MEELASLGYMQGVPSQSRAFGVVRRIDDSIAKGLNLMVSAHTPGVSLIDSSGKTLHSWTFEFRRVFPERLVSLQNKIHTQHWRRAFLQADGSVFAIFEGFGLIKVSKGSKLLWSIPAMLTMIFRLEKMGEFMYSPVPVRAFLLSLSPLFWMKYQFLMRMVKS